MVNCREWGIVVYGDLNKAKIPSKLVKSFGDVFRQATLSYCEKRDIADVFKLADVPSRFETTEFSVAISVINELLMDVEEDSDLKALVIFINDSGVQTVKEDLLKHFDSELLVMIRTGLDLIRCSRCSSDGFIESWVQEIFNVMKPASLSSDIDIPKKILCNSGSISNALDYLNSTVVTKRLTEPCSSDDSNICLLLTISVLLSFKEVQEVIELRKKCSSFLMKMLKTEFLQLAFFDRISDHSVFTLFCNMEIFCLTYEVLYFLSVAKVFCPKIAEKVYKDFLAVLRKIPPRFWATVDYDRLMAVSEKYIELKEFFRADLVDPNTCKSNVASLGCSSSFPSDTIAKFSLVQQAANAGDAFSSPGAQQLLFSALTEATSKTAIGHETSENCAFLRGRSTFASAHMQILETTEIPNKMVNNQGMKRTFPSRDTEISQATESMSKMKIDQRPKRELDAKPNLADLANAVTAGFSGESEVKAVSDTPLSVPISAPSVDGSTLARVRNGHIGEKSFRPAWEDCEKKEPPEDFRSLSVCITASDVIHPVRPYVRQNKKEGKYDSQEHYLDVQFRLLREDFLCPLRDGIAGYREKTLSGGVSSGFVFTDEDFDLVILKNVVVEGLQMKRNSGKIIRFVRFENQCCSDLRVGQRLKFGQMVALSSDEFKEEIYIGTIVERDEQFLSGRIGLSFTEDVALDRKKFYVLVESPSYFEMYQHVLNELKTFSEQRPVPFSRYLVDTCTKPVFPAYFTRKGPHETESGKRGIKVFGEFYAIERLVYTLDGSKVANGIDDMQRDALCYALTSDFALIQGPPGTGKTFLGRIILRILFENMELWNPARTTPLLVVCYTNHALDQFLEGILKDLETDDRMVNDLPSVVRFGGRSSSEILKKYQKGLIIDQYEHLIDRRKRAAVTKALVERRKVLQRILELVAVITRRNKMILSYKWVQLVMSDRHRCSFANARCQTYMTLSNDEILSEWLTLGPTEDDCRRLARELPLEYKNTNMSSVDPLYTDDEEEESDMEDAVQPKTFRTASNFEDVEDEEEEENPIVSAVMSGISMKTPEELFLESEEGIDEIYHVGEWDLEKKEGDKTHRVKIFAEKKNSDGKSQDTFDSEIIKRLDMVEEEILKAQPLDVNEAESIKDIYTIHKERRWMLYAFWREKLKAHVEKELTGVIKNYEKLCLDLDNKRSICDEEVLRKALVIGATTTGAAKARAQLNRLKCPIVVVEEAAEVLEAHVLSSIPVGCEHAILIGDHQQLRPNPAVFALAREYNLDISMFERLIRNGYPYKSLMSQHRMATLISDTLMPHFYPELENAKNVLNYPLVQGAARPLFFITHNSPETVVTSSVSHQNDFEAEFSACLAYYFVQQGYQPEDITILCAYAAQVSSVKRYTKEKLDPMKLPRIETVDSYQGEENNILILSLVRSAPSETVGFLVVPNRVCVALSRAKHGLFMIGNMDLLANRSLLWRKISVSLLDANCIDNAFPAYCAKHDRAQWITNADDFQVKVPNGGCDLMCGFSRSCGHDCERRCHSDDPDHAKPCEAVCGKPCGRTVFSHICDKQCGQPCGPCRRYETKKFACGHEVGVVCHLYDELTCNRKCARVLACGHPCSRSCSESCSCAEVVRILLPCGHTADVLCGQSLLNLRCTKLVIKKFEKCGHENTVECSQLDSAVCSAICGKLLPTKCGHRCISVCSNCEKDGCPEICANRCSKFLECGHNCPMLCGTKCSEICMEICDNECPHMKCREALTAPSKMLRKCVDACIFCMENCTVKGCKKKCWEPCKVQSLNESCKLFLECGHPCMGVESERCPELCAVCSAEELKQVFYSGKADGKLLQFNGCSCIMDIMVADQIVQQQYREQRILRCPKCSRKLTVLSCQRYAPLVKQQIIRLEKKKYLVLTGSEASNVAARNEIEKKLAREISLVRRAAAIPTNQKLLERLAVNMERYLDALKQSTLNSLGCRMWSLLLGTFHNLCIITRKFVVTKIETIPKKELPRLQSIHQKLLTGESGGRKAIAHDFGFLFEFLHNNIKQLSLVVPRFKWYVRRIYVMIVVQIKLFDNALLPFYGMLEICTD